MSKWLQLWVSVVTRVTTQFVLDELDAYAVQPLWAVLLLVFELVKWILIVLADQVNQLLREIPLDGCHVLGWVFIQNLFELSIGENQTEENDQEWEEVEVDDNEKEPYQVVDCVVYPHGGVNANVFDNQLLLYFSNIFKHEHKCFVRLS